MSLVLWAIGQCVLVLLSSENCLGFRVAAKSASDYCESPNVFLGRDLFSFCCSFEFNIVAMFVKERIRKKDT